MKQNKLKDDFIDHVTSTATDNTSGKAKARRVTSRSGNRLRTLREIRKLFKDSFNVNKQVDPFNTFKFQDTLSVKEAQDIRIKPEFKRNAYFCQDKLNVEYECYVIPSKIVKRKTSTPKVNHTNAIHNENEVKRGSARNGRRKGRINRRGRKTSFFSIHRNSISDTLGSSPTHLGSSRSFGFTSWKKGRKSSRPKNEPEVEVQETEAYEPDVGKLFEEFGVQVCCNHENLQRLVSTYLYEDCLFVFCESFKEAVNLREIIQNRSRSAVWTFLESHVAYIIKAVLDAVTYLHNENRVVCNLSLRSVFVLGGSQIKLGNLTEARELSMGRALLSDIKCEASYMAPEMLSSKFSKSIDIWSIGIMTKELLIGEFIKHRYNNDSAVSYNSRSDIATLIQISKGSKQTDEFSKLSHIEHSTKDFCKICLRKNINATEQDEGFSDTLSIENKGSVMVEELAVKNSKTQSRGYRPSATKLSRHPFLSLACSERTFVAHVEELNELAIF